MQEGAGGCWMGAAETPWAKSQGRSTAASGARRDSETQRGGVGAWWRASIDLPKAQPRRWRPAGSVLTVEKAAQVQIAKPKVPHIQVPQQIFEVLGQGALGGAHSQEEAQQQEGDARVRERGTHDFGGVNAGERC